MLSRAFRRKIHAVFAIIILATIYYLLTDDIPESDVGPSEYPKPAPAQMPRLQTKPRSRRVKAAPIQKEHTNQWLLARPEPPEAGGDDVEMVVASMSSENTTWLDQYLLDWKKNIYVVDDETARFTVPINKGREAMVFLTYDTRNSSLFSHILTFTATLLTDTIHYQAMSSSITPNDSNGTMTIPTMMHSVFYNDFDLVI